MVFKPSGQKYFFLNWIFYQSPLKTETMKRFLFPLIFIIVFTNELIAQQSAMFTQYMFNTVAVNPAYAGSKEVPTAVFLARKQWVSFDGAPVTQTFSINAPIKAKSLGLGLSVTNDKIGIVNETGFFIDVAYNLKLWNKANLSMGVKGGVNFYQAKLTELTIIDRNDPAFQKDIKGDFLPNVGVGFYYYTDKFYAGISTPKLLKNTISAEKGVNTQNLAKEERHYYFISGYVFDLGRFVKFKPSVLAKLVQGSPISFDITAGFLFSERLWLSGMYRVGDAVGGIVQYRIGQSLWVGYAYDYTVSDLTNFNSGTHEIMVSFDLVSKKYRVKSPRYF